MEDKIYVDRFGATLSGYTSVVNKAGQTVALVGVDINAEQLTNMQGCILQTTLIIFGGAALLIGFLSLAIARHVRRKPLKGHEFPIRVYTCPTTDSGNKITMTTSPPEVDDNAA